MPWKECTRVEERLRFVARILEGEKMASVCREFGISRKTGYKIFNRYKDCGLEGLADQSRRPHRSSRRLAFQLERTIIGIKREYPSWGAAKIREKLLRQYPDIKPPAKSTLSGARSHATKLKGPRLAIPIGPTVCGAGITKVSSCWATSVIVIR